MKRLVNYHVYYKQRVKDEETGLEQTVRKCLVAREHSKGTPNQGNTFQVSQIPRPYYVTAWPQGQKNAY